LATEDSDFFNALVRSAHQVTQTHGLLLGRVEALPQSLHVDGERPQFLHQAVHLAQQGLPLHFEPGILAETLPHDRGNRDHGDRAHSVEPPANRRCLP
jgi:hypothetical protein